MTYHRDLADILDEVLNLATYPVKITAVNNVGNNQELTVCDVRHAQAGYKVTINLIEYTIYSVDETTLKIVITGLANPIAVQTFNLYKPKFFHGTEAETGNTLEQKGDYLEKTPMVWLRENYKETFLPTGSRLGRESEVELYFLSWVDYSKQVDGRMADAVKPMRRLMQAVWEHFRASTKYFELQADKYDTFEVENFTKLGVYAINKGIAKALFMDNLAGPRLKCTLPIVRKISCTTC